MSISINTVLGLHVDSIESGPGSDGPLENSFPVQFRELFSRLQSFPVVLPCVPDSNELGPASCLWLSNGFTLLYALLQSS